MTDHEQHPTQGTPDPSEPERSEVDRRTFLKGAGTFGAAALSGPFLSKNWAFLSGGRSSLATTPIEHAIISCQENRSFDHYFGYCAVRRLARGPVRILAAGRGRRKRRPVPVHGALDPGRAALVERHP
jgi:hypothetical protein